ncbi:hypothetical protein PR048_021540 [Dryococelus australis]|uniref:Transposase n=1 Tax=Dryococelus australis TaxID=614101 RepID=A0ABQ9GYP5_9NEOP|nr:hypothetical protein PR048_021540 [Dryococelus australis]
MRGKVETRLRKTEFVAVTTDMWTTTSNNDYSSLTVHYLDEQFVLKHVCIEVVPFPEISHTAANLCDFITLALREWGIDNKVVAIVPDNGQNIVAGLEMSQFLHVPCLAHTFQLKVKDGFLNSKNISVLVATCRKLVGHLKHSALACKVLKRGQNLTNLPTHRLI